MDPEVKHDGSAYIPYTIHIFFRCFGYYLAVFG